MKVFTHMKDSLEVVDVDFLCGQQLLVDKLSALQHIGITLPISVLGRFPSQGLGEEHTGLRVNGGRSSTSGRRWTATITID